MPNKWSCQPLSALVDTLIKNPWEPQLYKSRPTNNACPIPSSELTIRPSWLYLFATTTSLALPAMLYACKHPGEYNGLPQQSDKMSYLSRLSITDFLPKRTSWGSNHSSDTTTTTSTMPTEYSVASSTGSRFGLDPTDHSPIVVFDYTGAGTHLSTQADLCADIDNKPGRRVTKKQIPTGEQHIDIRLHDFYLQDEAERYSKLPDYNLWLASSKLPMRVLLARNILDSYKTMYIVSRDADSPTTSPAPLTKSID